jgi:hypothetical protein
MVGELVAGLCVVFADFAEDMGADMQSVGCLLYGNLLTLNNIGTLNWHYNNTLNQLNKQDKNTTEYYVYDYQGSRVRAVIESDNQVQSQKDYYLRLAGYHWHQSRWWIAGFRCYGCCLGG